MSFDPEDFDAEQVAESISGGWNYRMVRRESEDGSSAIGIHEVYYDSDGEPRACTQNSVGPLGENREALVNDLERMEQALDKPVLDYDTF